MPQWTKEQQAAIQARNHTILVSAAAGSGKTAVLVERIVGLVREGYHLDRMLIVTFTRAAAAEMRQRLNQRMIKEAQSDPERMGQALDELESADISTIHSFCQKVIRNDFQAVGVDPLTRVCEEQQQQALFESAFCDAMNELLESQHAEFHLFADAFEQNEIREMTQRLYTFLMSLPEPFDWLDWQIERVNQKPYEEHPWYTVLAAHAQRQLEGIEVLLDAQQNMFLEADAVPQLEETFQKDNALYQRLMQSNLTSPKELAEALATTSFEKAAVCRGLTQNQRIWKKRFADIRDEIKTIVKEQAKALNPDRQKTEAELNMIQRELRGMAVLVKTTKRYFDEYKLRQNVMDFSDMEQLTLAILKNEECRERLQGEYDHIFVDECQDVSAVQDAILQSIHGENSCLFMVGDVKQSIYRFRLADPTLFLQRMRTFSDDENARERRIFLQKNFRSRKTVLDATNHVFRQIMRADVTELDYLPEDELIPGRVTENDPEVEIHLLDTDGDGENAATGLEAESQAVVNGVKFLLTQTLEENGTRRPYEYRDMVILLPKVARVGPALAELLKQQGVPVYYDGAESYFGLPEIRAVTALLAVLDNPLQDVPLLSTLKMTPFLFKDQELAEIRLCKTGRDVPFYEAFHACRSQETPLGKRCKDAWTRLENWRFQAETMRIRDFLWYLMRESGFYAACGALPEGRLRQANLRLLCQRASEYEDNGGVTLSGFLKIIDQQQQAGDSRSAKDLGENENLVRIMTIHKSKGLEFPVVFCLLLSSRMHLAKKPGLKMHSRLGVCLPYVNRALNIRRETMGDEAFEIQRLLDEKAERARLLYVAMTRARDRLILIGTSTAEEKQGWKLPTGSFSVWSAGSMMDWIMQTVYQHREHPQGETPWLIRTWDSTAAQNVEKNILLHSMQGMLNRLLHSQKNESTPLKWEETISLGPAKPLKTSVSSIAKKNVLKDPMPLTDGDEDEETKRQAETIVSPLKLSELPARPAFMEERHLTGAERGTVVHRVLSLLNLDALRGKESLSDALWAEIRRLEAQGCLTAEEVDVIGHRGLVQFFEGKLGKRLLASLEVHREWSFNLRMTDDDTLLQGVIDCAFREEDAWVLMDYKTDRIEDEQAFVERYTLQLYWYQQALERITGLRVKEKWLYALGKGKAFRVTP